MHVLSEITSIQKLLVQVYLACPRNRFPSFFVSLIKYTVHTNLPGTFPHVTLSLDSTNEVIQSSIENPLVSHYVLQNKAHTFQCVI